MEALPTPTAKNKHPAGPTACFFLLLVFFRCCCCCGRGVGRGGGGGGGGGCEFDFCCCCDKGLYVCVFFKCLYRLLTENIVFLCYGCGFVCTSVFFLLLLRRRVCAQ